MNQNWINNHLMEAADRDSLNGSLARWTDNICRHIWHHKPIRNSKIFSPTLVEIHKPRPRCSFAIQKPNIRSHIKASTQSLDCVGQSGGQSFWARGWASRCHRKRVSVFNGPRERGRAEQEEMLNFFYQVLEGFLFWFLWWLGFKETILLRTILVFFLLKKAAALTVRNGYKRV